MKHRAEGCSCTKDIGMSKAREPHFCNHGNLFVYEKALGRSPKESEDAATRAKASPRRRKPAEPRRDWAAARAKVDEERCCRVCKRTDRKLEAAHILGREHDEPKISESTGEILKELFVEPVRIVPACGPFPDGCHGDIDMRRINLLPHLTLAEQMQAVRDAGGIEAARIRLAPVEHREEVEASSASRLSEADQLRARVAELEAGIAA